MKNQNNHHPTNFWLGFALGVSGAAALAYLLGTEKGRDTAKKIIEYAQNCEEGSEEFLDLMSALKNFAKKGLTEEALKSDGATHTLDTLIEKVKHITDGPKDVFVNHKK